MLKADVGGDTGSSSSLCGLGDEAGFGLNTVVVNGDPEVVLGRWFQPGERLVRAVLVGGDYTVVAAQVVDVLDDEFASLAERSQVDLDCVSIHRCGSS